MSENMELMGDIAGAIVNSGKLSSVQRTEISIVVDFDDEGEVIGIYGYAYEKDGGSTAVAPKIREIEAPVSAYREWLRQEGDKGMIKMLFQFNRETLKVNADFEYDDSSRWKVTPANIDTIVEELRPNLGG